jgi:cellobiose-specific phosphotransferase system component IIC
MWSLARVPATWPEPYVTENGVVVGLNVEEEPVLNELPVVHLPVLDVPFVLPPREGFWVAPCCWQLLAVTQRSLEIE